MSELLRAGGESTVKVIHQLCNKIYKKEQCPEDWAKAIIFPLRKKNDKHVW